MPTYSQLLAAIARSADGTRRVTIPDSWKQGRTTYGGLTAALCLDAGQALAGGRPIRSAQVAFVGPVSGEVVATPVLLREGKNTAFVSVRLVAEDGIVAEAIFSFGAAHTCSLDFEKLPAPEVPPPEALGAFFPSQDVGPAFARNFDILLAAGSRPVSGAQEADISLWMRHRDPHAPLDAVALLALADAPPPAAMSLFTAPGRISSMTWMAEFLTDQIATDEGWFLARHIAQTARDGYSSQAMTIWNRSGAPIMIGRQTIAVFA